MRHLILSAALLVGLAASVSARDHQDDPFLTPKADRPALDWIEDALRMPAVQLALYAHETAVLSDPELEITFGVASALGIRITVPILYPDGTVETVALVTFEELEQYLTKNRRLHDAYKRAIIQRGFKQLAPSYDATVSPGCSEGWFASGEVAVQQDEFMLRVSQAGRRFSGVVVEDIVFLANHGLTVEDRGDPPLTGKYGDIIELIELQDVGSKCSITLRASGT